MISKCGKIYSRPCPSTSDHKCPPNIQNVSGQKNPQPFRAFFIRIYIYINVCFNLLRMIWKSELNNVKHHISPFPTTTDIPKIHSHTKGLDAFRSGSLTTQLFTSSSEKPWLLLQWVGEKGPPGPHGHTVRWTLDICFIWVSSSLRHLNDFHPGMKLTGKNPSFVKKKKKRHSSPFRRKISSVLSVCHRVCTLSHITRKIPEASTWIPIKNTDFRLVKKRHLVGKSATYLLSMVLIQPTFSLGSVPARNGSKSAVGILHSAQQCPASRNRNHYLTSEAKLWVVNLSTPQDSYLGCIFGWVISCNFLMPCGDWLLLKGPCSKFHPQKFQTVFGVASFATLNKFHVNWKRLWSKAKQTNRQTEDLTTSTMIQESAFTVSHLSFVGLK